MDPVVILITLIATFASENMKDIQFYSHNPNVMFVSRDMCNDVLSEANDYFHDGAKLYTEQEFPNETLSTLTLECMTYTINPSTGDFEPLEYEYNGEWDSYKTPYGDTI